MKTGLRSIWDALSMDDNWDVKSSEHAGRERNWKEDGKVKWEALEQNLDMSEDEWGQDLVLTMQMRMGSRSKKSRRRRRRKGRSRRKINSLTTL